ncbi:hypothetical protein BESB_013570 [Besnoitia besnoiti]|uniref:Uncharacterized protein n=1 Tax=Besnoitia besnoiti TaxID=94643 RepID=A0A2A9M455_BESBE|nr:hypothetical protein BESB_013570 [Besnoitia besnoiti]PFH32745.1 hypothetical protein BESB_013570 [Besnoitia besnoiti]
MPAQAAEPAGAVSPADGRSRPPSRGGKAAAPQRKREGESDGVCASPLPFTAPPVIAAFPPDPDANVMPPQGFAEGLTPEMKKQLEDRGLRPCTLREVLERRSKKWAKVQMISAEARSEKERLDSLFKQQCVGWGNNQEGWVYGKWNPVILCPDFRQGGLQVSRSGRRQLWECLKSVVEGFVDPRLQICEVLDPTHPVRFATPPDETCFTVVYVGPKIPASRQARVVFGEYTGVVKDGGLVKKRFEYVFDLSFCALAWRRAEEFETASDSSDDNCGPAREKGNAAQPAEGAQDTRSASQRLSPAGGREKRKSVTVSGRRDAKGLARVELPARSQFVLDSSEACNEMSLVNHYGTIELLGDCVCKRNSEWQQVFVDGWPHIVLTSIPGVSIEPGDEILADFGNAWFFKVQDAAHGAIARELLEYRVGLRTAPSQKLVCARPLECVNRRVDPRLKNRARAGEICPYCLSHEHRAASCASPSPPGASSPESLAPRKGAAAKHPEEGAPDRVKKEHSPALSAGSLERKAQTPGLESSPSAGAVCTPSQKASPPGDSQSNLLVVTEQLEREQAFGALATPGVVKLPPAPLSNAVVTPQPKGGDAREGAEDEPRACEADAHAASSSAAFSGDEVVHCDGCDRPCHLRCLPDPEAILNDWRWYCAVCRMRFFEMCRHLNYQVVLSSEALASLEKEGILSAAQSVAHASPMASGFSGSHALALKTPVREEEEAPKREKRQGGAGSLEDPQAKVCLVAAPAKRREEDERQKDDREASARRSRRGDVDLTETGHGADRLESSKRRSSRGPRDRRSRSAGSQKRGEGLAEDGGAQEAVTSRVCDDPLAVQPEAAATAYAATPSENVEAAGGEEEAQQGAGAETPSPAPLREAPADESGTCSRDSDVAGEKENVEPAAAAGGMEFLNVTLDELGKGSETASWADTCGHPLPSSSVLSSELAPEASRTGETEAGEAPSLGPGGASGACSQGSENSKSERGARVSALAGKERDVFSLFACPRANPAAAGASHAAPMQGEKGASPLAAVTTTAESSESDEDAACDASAARGGAAAQAAGAEAASSAPGTADGARFEAPPAGVRERRAVYDCSAEKMARGRMAPTRVEIVPGDLSKVELQGLQTLHLVDPKGLLGSLQPCEVCYKALGERASTEVCRLAKRHLSPNWDHPHSTTPHQMKDAILTAFQEKVHSMQEEAKKRAQSVTEEIRQLKLSFAAKLQQGHHHAHHGAALSTDKHGTGGCAAAAHAASRKRSRGACSPEVLGMAQAGRGGGEEEKDARPEDNLPAPLTSGFIPLIGVHLGKTVIDRSFNVGWFEGLITEYSAVAVEDGKWYANQFQVEYADGDTECLKVEELVHLLAEHGIRHVDPATRHQYKTTTLDKLLAPEILAAKKELNLRFRKCKQLEEKEESERNKRRKKASKMVTKRAPDGEEADGEDDETGTTSEQEKAEGELTGEYGTKTKKDVKKTKNQSQGEKEKQKAERDAGTRGEDVERGSAEAQEEESMQTASARCSTESRKNDEEGRSVLAGTDTSEDGQGLDST